MILEPVKVLLVALEKNCAMLLEISARHRYTRANWLSDISLTASGVGERYRSYGSLTFDSRGKREKSTYIPGINKLNQNMTLSNGPGPVRIGRGRLSVILHS